jgi:hypothetical protein
MRFARSSPNFGARDPLQTFDCAMCGLSVTKTVTAKTLELTGHTAA